MTSTLYGFHQNAAADAIVITIEQAIVVISTVAITDSEPFLTAYTLYVCAPTDVPIFFVTPAIHENRVVVHSLIV